MPKSNTVQDKKGGKPQLSKVALMEMTRPHAVEAIATLAKEMKSGDNSNARIGAAKAILAKVLPDLKSSEITAEEGIKLILEIVHDRSLQDANKKDTAPDQELPSTE